MQLIPVDVDELDELEELEEPEAFDELAAPPPPELVLALVSPEELLAPPVDDALAAPPPEPTVSPPGIGVNGLVQPVEKISVERERKPTTRSEENRVITTIQQKVET